MSEPRKSDPRDPVKVLLAAAMKEEANGHSEMDHFGEKGTGFCNCKTIGYSNDWPCPVQGMARALRILVEAVREVYASVPSTYDKDDPMVKRHARALNAIPEAIEQAASEVTHE